MNNACNDKLYLKQCFFQIFIIFMFFGFILNAKHISINFDRLTVDDGLSQSVVNSIFQDKSGFMWIGTKDGLNRFDGYKFMVYKNDPDVETSLSNNTINSIWQDDSGVLWIGTIDGLNLKKNDDNNFKRIYYEDERFKNTINNIKVIKRLNKNRVLIGTWGAGLLITDLEGKVLSHHYYDKERKDSLGNNKITDIFKDSRGEIWVLTVSGINRLVNNNGIYKRYLYYKHNKSDIETDALYSIVEVSKGKLLIGLYNKGLFEYNNNLDRFIPAQICDPDKNVIKKIMGIVKDDYDNLWLATDGKGLIRVNRKNGYCENYINEENNLSSISFDEILTIYKDREGSIWLGTDQGGISKFNLKEKKFNIINKIHYKNKNIDIRGVWAIYKDKLSPLWIGTDSNGLIKLDEKNKSCFIFKHGGINSISHNQILSISRESRGGLWIGTDGGGLDRYIPNKSQFVIYKNTEDSCSISDNYILTVFEDDSGITWAGSYAGGLSRLDTKTKKFKNYLHNNQIKNSIAGNFVVSIEKNDSGSLWIGTYGFGLDLFDKKTGFFKHYKYSLEDTNSLSSNTILYLFMDNTILWIGTRGGGLNKFNLKTQKFRYYMEKDGLANNTVTGIVSDNKGFLWISTKGGLSKFNPANETFRNYDKRDGIQSREFNFGSCFKDSEGIIYFGGIKGLNFFDPDNVKDNTFVTKCKITKILKNDNSVNINKSYKKGIKIKNDEFPLYIEFSLLSYISPFKDKYTYKINGLDKSWHYVDSKSRFVLYNNLPYGDYTFCFKGCNNDGVWQKEASRINLSVIPPYWHTLPFEIFLLFIFSIISYIIIGFVKRHIKLINFWKKKKYINNFELLDEIGSGGMGTIYKAMNMINKKEIVAIKILKNELFNDEKNRKRFKQEAVIIDQLDHPNIVKIIERGISNNNLYMIMELLEGKTLSEIIIGNKIILFDDIIHIMKQVLDAVEKVHKKNIIHRDIKPDNVMLIRKNGDDKFVKLLDFGLATMEYQTRLTQTGMVVGTINYMAPEQITESITSKATDIYSLGVMLYEMVAGRRPYAGESTIALMKQIIDENPIEPIKFRIDISKRLNDLIVKMMNKDSSKRPTLSEIIDTINTL